MSEKDELNALTEVVIAAAIAVHRDWDLECLNRRMRRA
jgi:hypothetical protein